MGEDRAHESPEAAGEGRQVAAVPAAGGGDRGRRACRRMRPRLSREHVPSSATGRSRAVSGRGGADGSTPQDVVIRYLAAVVLCGLALAACEASQGGPSVEETGESAVVGEPLTGELSSAERFSTAPYTEGDVSMGGAPTPDRRVPGAASSFDAANLRWTAPPGWLQSDERSMRIATWRFEGAGDEAECYVSVLLGSAGGVLANVNRWRGQMGHPPMGADEVEALPNLEVLGREARFVELEGSFTSMTGELTRDAALLGVICELYDAALFIKLTGPKAVVQAQRDSFIAFSQSMSYDG